jgi:hypothetical protein
LPQSFPVSSETTGTETPFSFGIKSYLPSFREILQRTPILNPIIARNNVHQTAFSSSFGSVTLY